MRLFAGLFFCLAVGLLFTRPARALPVFAHRYSLTCQACHSTVPRLNDFGKAFRARGYSLPGARGVFPLALKVNLAYSSDPDASGLPKAIVDEIELLSGGSAAKNTSFFFEQYVVDGGRPGMTRDAWMQFNSGNAHLKVGQFELPLPVEVESERETLEHYALYDQSVGANTFAFFDPRLGIEAAFGSEDGLRAHVSLLQAYDRHTTTPRSGIDLMGSLSKSLGNLTLQTYRYQGRRNFAVPDVFWRQGYAAQYEHEKVSLTGVLQTGEDRSADGLGLGAHSSGGFLEGTYYFSDAVAVIARYDGTSDSLSGTQRQFVISGAVRPRRNMRFTIEGSAAGSHDRLSAAFMFAY